MSKPLVNLLTIEINCDVSDYIVLWHEFLTIVGRLNHVNILNSSYHIFPNDGFTGLILLAESHAAIHTFPEHKKVWCELATCGDISDLELFRTLLIELENKITQDSD